MPTEKRVKGVVIPRHDTMLNWSKALNFVPAKGELIVYDADSAEVVANGYDVSSVVIGTTSYDITPSDKVRFKFGNGKDNVNALPFQTDLDNNGLSHLWSKIVNLFNKRIEVSETAPTEEENKIWLQPITTNAGAVDDYIVDEGVSDIWTYRKWNSGLVEMWGIATGLNGSYSVDVGYGIDNTITLPFSLIDTNYCVNVTMRGNSLIEKYNTKSYTTSSFVLSLYTENPNISQSSSSANINVVGRLK